MRFVRWAIGVAAALGSLALVATVFTSSSVSCDEGAAGPGVAFVGTVDAKDGRDVTFRVDRAMPEFAPLARQAEPGQRAIVGYEGGDERFLHTGESYEVDAIGVLPDPLRSDVHTAHECTGNAGRTVHADGSAINTGVLTREGIEPYVPWVAGVVIITAIGAGAIAGYQRRKHPRLTIDGQPLSSR